MHQLKPIVCFERGGPPCQVQLIDVSVFNEYCLEWSHGLPFAVSCLLCMKKVCLELGNNARKSE